MTTQRLQLGGWGEEQAVAYLLKKRWKILQRNYRCPAGEIDIIAVDGPFLVFVEVKTRRSTRFGAPQEAVGTRKQRQILRAAQWFLLERRDLDKLQPRFDVIGIVCGSDQGAEIQHILDAFSL